MNALSDEENEILDCVRDHGETPRIRRRAQAVLLSSSGRSVNEIADIFDTTPVTVRSWLDRWEKHGPLGLGDKSRPGGPPKLTDDEREQVLALINESPDSPRTVLEKIKGKTRETISARTLRRLARSAGLRWKRRRRSLKSQRNEEEFRVAQAELEEIIRDHKAGDYDVYYFDEYRLISGRQCGPWRSPMTESSSPMHRTSMSRLSTWQPCANASGATKLPDHDGRRQFQGRPVEGSADAKAR